MNAVKKIMFFLPCIGYGGIEQVVKNIAFNISDEYDVIITGQIALTNNLFKQVKIPKNIQILETKFNEKYESDRYLPMFVWDMYKKINQYSPDVIFTFWHRTNLTAGVVMSVINVPSRPKWVFNVHGESPGYYGSNLIDTIKRYLLKSVAKKASSHVTITKSLVLRCNDYYKDCNFILKYNPVVNEDILHLADEELSHPWFQHNNKTILAIGRLDPMKDYKTLIEAFRLLHIQDNDIRLFILGEGPQRNELQEYIDSKNLSDVISMPGFKINPYKYIKRCKIFCISSSHGEASPMVLAEAMFLQKPIVATNFATAKDIISDNITGLIANPGDCKNLSMKIMKLLDSPELSEQFGVMAKKVAIERYSIRESVKEYRILLNQLVC